LCGAFPTSSSFSRSALNLYAGAQTGWATVFSVIVILVSLLFFTPVLHHVPQSVLAAIVIAAVLGLLKPRTFLRLLKINRVEGSIAVLTFVITLASAPRLYWGVLAGVVMGLSYFLHTRLHPRIIEVGLHPDGSLRDRHLWQLPPLVSHLYALRMDAELDFAAASGFERAITEHLSRHPDVKHVCLFAQPINRIDLTGVETFIQVRRQLQDRGITLHISGIKLPVERALHNAGELQDSPWLKMYRTDTEALQALRQLDPLPPDMAQIKVSFIHHGVRIADCRPFTAEEQAKMAKNMRQTQKCERERSPVSIEVDIDGKSVLRHTSPPSGLSRDGASTVYQRLDLPAGEHRIAVRFKDNKAVEGFTHQREETVILKPAQVMVIDFNLDKGGIVLL